MNCPHCGGDLELAVCPHCGSETFASRQILLPVRLWP